MNRVITFFKFQFVVLVRFLRILIITVGGGREGNGWREFPIPQQLLHVPDGFRYLLHQVVMEDENHHLVEVL